MLEVSNLMQMYQGGPPPTMRQARGAVSVSQASMGSHSLKIERRSSDGRLVESGTVFYPIEPLRFSIVLPSSRKPTSLVDFYVYPMGGSRDAPVMTGKGINVNLAGRAWWDTVAPPGVGEWVVEAVMGTIHVLLPVPPFFPLHNATMSFSTSETAPKPVDKPKGGFNWDDAKTLAYIALGIVAISALAPVAGKLIPDRRG